MAADTLHKHLVEALARRAAASEGAVRERLEARVAQLRAAEAPQREPAPAVASPSPLAALLDHIARHSESPSPGAPPELKSLRWFRRTWTRLNTDQRLTQSQAGLPGNAGPLHSQRLLHRALTAMRELSPGYLEHFVAHADALVWLDQLTGGDVGAKKDVLLAEGERGRAKARRAQPGRTVNNPTSTLPDLKPASQ